MVAALLPAIRRTKTNTKVMKMITPIKRIALAALMLAGTAAFAAQPEAASDAKPSLRIAPAERVEAATMSQILGATRAGTRIVAVGDHGIVLLSDNDGKHFAQAHAVPINATLNAVSFVDAHTGWAVGHWGAIIKTVDGGETWTLERSDTTVDQPLFSVYFKDAREGWAVGLWSLMLHTTDGGATWSRVQLPPPPGQKKADRNLYAIFADAKGNLFVACEQGRILRSSDGGQTWSYVETGYAGSFWTGVALTDGTLLVAGLRGTIYRSTDDGNTWQQIPTQDAFKSSLTDIVQGADKRILAVGLEGVMLESRDGGVSFTGQQRADRSTLTAVVDAGPGKAPVLFSTSGPLSP
jgi:photosystem II stability/assembly factor-like uncharacterized protein